MNRNSKFMEKFPDEVSENAEITGNFLVKREDSFLMTRRREESPLAPIMEDPQEEAAELEFGKGTKTLSPDDEVADLMNRKLSISPTEFKKRCEIEMSRINDNTMSSTFQSEMERVSMARERDMNMNININVMGKIFAESGQMTTTGQERGPSPFVAASKPVVASAMAAIKQRPMTIRQSIESEMPQPEEEIQTKAETVEKTEPNDDKPEEAKP